MATDGWCLRVLLTVVCLQTRAGHADGQGAQQNVTVHVLEGDDATLPCYLNTRGNIAKMLFDWKRDGQKEVFLYDSGETYLTGRVGQDVQYVGRVELLDKELKHGDASLRLKDAKLADTGVYSCDFPRLRRAMSYVTFIVGAAPPPRTRIVDAVGDRVLLNCSVRGAYPRPEVEWQDDDRNVLPAAEPQISQDGEGRYNIDLIVTVTKSKTNRYRCVAKQEAIGHITHEEIYVPEKMFYDDTFCLGRSIGLGLGLGLVGLPLAVLLTMMCTRKRGQTVLLKEPLTPNGSEGSTDSGDSQSAFQSIQGAAQSAQSRSSTYISTNHF